MQREIPRHVPKLTCTGSSTSTTYHFRNAAKDFGWALATVNDTTGELNIQSDWGNYSHMWCTRPSSLGCPTLHHFIARCNDCDYLADKLWPGGGYGGSRFSPGKTVAHLRRKLAEKRLEEGRHHLILASYGYGRAGVFIDDMDRGACSASSNKRKYYAHQSWTGADGEPLTKGIAREIWDALDEFEDLRDQNLFIERLYNINGHSWLGEELWDEMQEEQDPMYQVLLFGILPALVEQCRGWVARQPVEPSPAAEAAAL